MLSYEENELCDKITWAVYNFERNKLLDLADIRKWPRHTWMWRMAYSWSRRCASAIKRREISWILWPLYCTRPVVVTTDENGRAVPHHRVASGIDLREELAVWQTRRPTIANDVRYTPNDPRGTIDRQTAKTQLVRRSFDIVVGRPLGIGLTVCPDLTKLYAAWVLAEPSRAQPASREPPSVTSTVCLRRRIRLLSKRIGTFFFLGTHDLSCDCHQHDTQTDIGDVVSLSVATYRVDQKSKPQTLVHIFAKYWSIFKILSLLHLAGNLQ